MSTFKRIAVQYLLILLYSEEFPFILITSIKEIFFPVSITTELFPFFSLQNVHYFSYVTSCEVNLKKQFFIRKNNPRVTNK